MSFKQKTAGIAVDDYKLAFYKRELRRSGFDDFDVFTFTKGTSLIEVRTTADRIHEIHNLCRGLELSFKGGIQQ